jgi:signal transduction histidine kinase/ActR/RegA family two-component response regulator
VETRDTGIEIVGPTPWGTHFCQFYETAADLEEILVPYLRAGLAANELCMWVCSRPLEADRARELLARVVPDLEARCRSGQLQILPHDRWYLEDGRFDGERVIRGWMAKNDEAARRGFEGLRITGNVSWLAPADWRRFTEYEAAVDPLLRANRILSVCTYPLDRCGAVEIADVIANHQFALLRREGGWDRIESTCRRSLEEEHRAERARLLERGLRRFELLAGTARDLLRHRDPEEALRSLCSRVREYLGCEVFLHYGVDEATGRLHLETHEGLPEAVIREFEWLEPGEGVSGSVARTGEPLVFEDATDADDRRTERLRRLGARSIACHPLIGTDGRVLGTVAFGCRRRLPFDAEELSLLRAVADQASVAMARLRDEETLREADRRKSEFLAVLSHELRNPLAPVVNGLHVLDHASPTGEQALRARTVIRRQVEHLSRLVDDLLDVTRLGRNRVSLQLETVELNELVHRTVEDLRCLFEKNRIRLELSLFPEAIPVHVDPTRIAQVAGNLLQNAAKFGSPGGYTRVEVRRAGEMAVLEVSDDGMGMSAETEAHLFEPFAQADQSPDRRRGGLGLGLALVKGLVELHGGTVAGHSDGPGRGSRFTVSLPTVAAPAPGLLGVAAGGKDFRRRVLVIDDNLDAAESLRDVLELNGHEVRVAEDGPGGIALARRFVPDVLVCDLGLPGMDGYEVARTFRADPVLAGVFLVALSGYALPEDRRRSAAAGFVHHLAKPPDLDFLEGLLRDLPPSRPETVSGKDRYARSA